MIVTRVTDIPDEESFAILTPTSTTIPGDERSRMHPGHGYPEHTVDHWQIEIYHSKESWQIAVKQLTEQRRTFKAVIIKAAKITTQITVE